MEIATPNAERYDLIPEAGRPIDYIFVHCTATSQRTTIESLRLYWREKLHWIFPGYHYVVMPGGEIEKLCELTTIANGVKGYNRSSIHVAWLGGIDRCGRPTDNRTVNQKASLFCILHKFATHYPNAKILGHRDISPDLNHNGIVDPWERIKECPCFDVATEYEKLITP